MYPERAVVIGGGLSGLYVARVLSDFFEEVVILERDPEPVGIAARKGVPQGTHVHGLQPHALALMNKYFPGLEDDLTAAGAVSMDFTERVRMYMANGWLPQRRSGVLGLSLTRPLLEAFVRQHVQNHLNIWIRWQARVLDLQISADKVTGITCQHGETTTHLECALAVDASGRGTRLGKWLSKAGFPEPAVSSIHVDVRYATALYERPPGDDSIMGYVIRHYPMDKLGAALLPVENNQWLLSLSGRFGVYPGKDQAAFMASASTLPIPDVHELLKEVPATTDVTAYTFSHNEVRHLTDDMPAGILPVGDTVIALNPLYGQGMTSSIKQADLLHHSLSTLPAGKPFDSQSLTKRHIPAINRFSEPPWKRAVLGDTIFSEASGDIPASVIQWREEEKRLNAMAAEDPNVARLIFEVAQFAESPEKLDALLR